MGDVDIGDWHAPSPSSSPPPPFPSSTRSPDPGRRDGGDGQGDRGDRAGDRGRGRRRPAAASRRSPPPVCKVSLLTHLVAEAAGEDGAAELEATAWVADLLRAPLRVELGTRRPLVLQMVHDPTALDPRCRFQVRDALHLF
ncbi:hypothetical protein ZWY2020_021269 [Hordeum vulgare]|nr:hypothetical protein ZWY2020_021269 [Hordeum vulgare]